MLLFAQQPALLKLVCPCWQVDFRWLGEQGEVVKNQLTPGESCFAGISYARPKGGALTTPCLFNSDRAVLTLFRQTSLPLLCVSMSPVVRGKEE